MYLNLFESLPDVIIIEVSKYLSNISYRNGKYIYKISKNDFRYELLEKIKNPLLIPSINNKYIIHILKVNCKNGLGFIILYKFNLNTKHTYLEIKKYTIGNVRGTWFPIRGEIEKEKYTINENGLCLRI